MLEPRQTILTFRESKFYNQMISLLCMLVPVLLFVYLYIVGVLTTAPHILGWQIFGLLTFSSMIQIFSGYCSLRQVGRRLDPISDWCLTYLIMERSWILGFFLRLNTSAATKIGAGALAIVFGLNLLHFHLVAALVFTITVTAVWYVCLFFYNQISNKIFFGETEDGDTLIHEYGEAVDAPISRLTNLRFVVLFTNVFLWGYYLNLNSIALVGGTLTAVFAILLTAFFRRRP